MLLYVRFLFRKKRVFLSKIFSDLISLFFKSTLLGAIIILVKMATTWTWLSIAVRPWNLDKDLKEMGIFRFSYDDRTGLVWQMCFWALPLSWGLLFLSSSSETCMLRVLLEDLVDHRVIWVCLCNSSFEIIANNIASNSTKWHSLWHWRLVYIKTWAYRTSDFYWIYIEIFSTVSILSSWIRLYN